MSKLAIAEAMIGHYNAQDADAYAALMTADACEANYRGMVLRDGQDGTCAGLMAMFRDFPQNRVEIVERQAIGDFVVLRERVFRGVKVGETTASDPFDVIAVYSFAGNKCSRVEFIR